MTAGLVRSIVEEEGRWIIRACNTAASDLPKIWNLKIGFGWFSVHRHSQVEFGQLPVFREFQQIKGRIDVLLQVALNVQRTEPELLQFVSQLKETVLPRCESISEMLRCREDTTLEKCLHLIRSIGPAVLSLVRAFAASYGIQAQLTRSDSGAPRIGQGDR